MGDRSVNSPPGICWAAYSDSALLQGIKTIATELQSRAAARASAAGETSGAARPAGQQSLEDSAKLPAVEDAKKMEEPRQEWY